MNTASTDKTEPKCDVLLITGFLGAGKTTLLKRILAWETDPSDTVVIVNEFGEVGIDGALLRNAGSDVVELTSGCVCCSLGADLSQSLSRLWQQYHPKRIIIEASGVADPVAIIPLLRDPMLSSVMQLKKIVSVLEVDTWQAREVLGELFNNQLEAADLVLLNKVDSADANDIPRYLEEIHAAHPNCQVIPTMRCAIDADALWSSADPNGTTRRAMDGLNHNRLAHKGHTHPVDAVETGRTTIAADHFVTFSFEDSRAIDEKRFRQFVQGLPYEVFRMKGSVRLADRTEFVNFVGGKAEWGPWDGDQRTQLAFIGWDIMPDHIIGQLNACRLPIEVTKSVRR